MQWCVDVGRPFELDVSDEDLDAIAGMYCDSAGSGFGCRDMQYIVKSKRRAVDIARQFEALMNVRPLGTECDPSTFYVSVYWEPKSSFMQYMKYEARPQIKSLLRKVMK